MHTAQCLEIRDRPILENDLERNAYLYRFDLIKCKCKNRKKLLTTYVEIHYSENTVKYWIRNLIFSMLSNTEVTKYEGQCEALA